MAPLPTDHALLETWLGPQFKFKLMATTLAQGTAKQPSGLPTDVGPLPLYALDDPMKVGMDPEHPLITMYPRVQVVHYVAACQPNMVVQSGTRQGVPVCLDFSGTETMAEVVASIEGVCALAPSNWKGAKGEPTNPRTPTDYLPRHVFMYDRWWLWHPGLTVNGQGVRSRGQFPVGFNRLYGRPADISKIYEDAGVMEQFIITPHDPRISTASQATGENDLKYPYIGFLVWQTTKEGSFYTKHARFDPTIGADKLPGVISQPLPELSIALGRPIKHGIPQRTHDLGLFHPEPTFIVFVHLTTSSYVDHIFGEDERF